MSYTPKEIREILTMEGIEVFPVDRKDSSCNLFPEGLDFGAKSTGEEKAVELFLSYYRNPNYSCYYLDDSFSEEDHVEEIEKFLEDYSTPLCLDTEIFCYKILAGYYASSFLFSYRNEVGAVTVGILYPNLLGE